DEGIRQEGDQRDDGRGGTRRGQDEDRGKDGEARERVDAARDEGAPVCERESLLHGPGLVWLRISVVLTAVTRINELDDHSGVEPRGSSVGFVRDYVCGGRVMGCCSEREVSTRSRPVLS